MAGMYSLLPDESGCRSVLGTLVYTERKHYGFSPKIVDVIVPNSLLFGHVDYKLEISATPHNSIDNEPRIFGLTTRFKELNNLYSTLSTIHRQLYLKGKIPSFAEAKIFGANDAQTVVERRASIETFLQFVLNSEVLCKSMKFQQFLEPSTELKAEENGDLTKMEEVMDENDAKSAQLDEETETLERRENVEGSIKEIEQ